MKRSEQKTAKVAVVTRTKDRPLLLDRAIRSVMQQTLDDLTMVVVNDGGDASAVEEVVQRRASQARDRIVVVHNDRSLGMEAASNIGIKTSDSEFLTIHDDDDTWHPSFLQAAVGAIGQSGRAGAVTDTVVVSEDVTYGDIRLMDRVGYGSPPTSQEGEALDDQRDRPTSFFRILGGNTFPPIAFMYRREVLAEVGYYDESLPVLGDWDFNVRFLRRFDIEYVPLPLAYYHQRLSPSGELSNSVFAESDLHDAVRERLLNRYLREDLEGHELGIGYLANLLHDLGAQRKRDAAALEELAATARQDRAALDELSAGLKRLVSGLTAAQADSQRADPDPPSARAKAMARSLRAKAGGLVERVERSRRGDTPGDPAR